MIRRLGVTYFGSFSNSEDAGCVIEFTWHPMGAFSGPCFGKQDRRCGSNRVCEKGGPTSAHVVERRWFIMTVVRWPWKSVSAKECVTTQRPNGPALKIDGPEATMLFSHYALALGCLEALCRRVPR